MLNAFSLPGGPVYIGEGMLDLMTAEDELANVLAHEVEHIDHYHCVERVQVEAQLYKKTQSRRRRGAGSGSARFSGKPVTTRDEELSQLAIQSLTGYFRSHPLPSERLAQATRIIAQEHWEFRTERKPFRVEYEVHNGEFVK